MFVGSQLSFSEIKNKRRQETCCEASDVPEIHPYEAIRSDLPAEKHSFTSYWGWVVPTTFREKDGFIYIYVHVTNICGKLWRPNADLTVKYRLVTKQISIMALVWIRIHEFLHRSFIMYLLHILIRYPHRWRLGSCPNGTLQLQGFLHPLHPKKNIEGFWWSLLHPKMFCRSRTDQRLASSQSFCLPACYSVHVFVDCKFIPAFLTTHLVINPAQKARSFGVPKKFSKFCKEVLGLASTSEYLKVANGKQSATDGTKPDLNIGFQGLVAWFRAKSAIPYLYQTGSGSRELSGANHGRTSIFEGMPSCS